MTEINEFVWVDKYRPKNINECILTKDLTNTFIKLKDSGTFPNLILHGPSGIGKTSVAKALLDEIDADYIVVNGSLNGNIDTLRTEILQFASTMSFTNKRKYVILDEADYLNAHSTQPALRNFMEQYAVNCGFILTCNYVNKIIEPLQSRCSLIEFNVSSGEKQEIAAKFYKKILHILDMENVVYNNKVVAALIMKNFPDWRRVINELQKYSITSDINTGILNENSFDKTELLKIIKKKDFILLRTYIAENMDNMQGIYQNLYNEFYSNIKPTSLAEFIVIIGKYQYQASFVASQEINIAACLSEIMVNVELS